jgi:hypothetical protein
MKRGRGVPCAARSPLRGAPRATLQGAPFQEELQRSHVPQKLCNSPHSGPHPEGESQIIRNIVINHNTDLLDERSTTGFRFR